MAALILIVEDESDIADLLEYNLRQDGYRTVIARTGEQALQRSTGDSRPDLIVLDLMLPDLAGTEVCRILRQREATRRVPIIMLTAKAEEIDRVVGFEVGADDYVTKPFSVRELLLRVRAILRRGHANGETSKELSFGALRIDSDSHRVWVDGKEVALTALEFRLLTTLLSRKGRVQTRERLLQDVWDMSSEVTTRTVDTHVKRLRHKIGNAAAYIETLRGVGYRFQDAEPRPGDR
ncbi:MAG: response regulator transcription factor [Proteobacteria bacterium]|nr:response regulator transcription factor [Pseudomonadota bacterium]